MNAEPEFLVVVPSIRQNLPGFAETMEAIRATFTRPTDFHVLDGKGGKVPCLNRAFDELLVDSEARVYVTLDDDIIPEAGWQDKTISAFDQDILLGIVSPWFGDDEQSLQVMGTDSFGDWENLGELKIRRLNPWRHIPGGLLAFRKKVAIEIGKQPETGLDYEIYEDAWRGRRAYKLGYGFAYIGDQKMTMVAYPDPHEYLEKKKQDIEKGRAIQDEIFADAGISDPLSWRMRRFAAKLLGRSKS